MKKILLTIALIFTFIFAYSQEYDDVYYQPGKDTTINVTNNYFVIDWNYGYTPLNYNFSWYNIYTPYYDPYYFYSPFHFYPYYYPYYYNWNYYQPYWYHHHYYGWNYYHPYNHHSNHGYYYGPRKSVGSYSTPPKNNYRKPQSNIRTEPKHTRPTNVNTRTTQPQRYTPPEYRNRRSSQEYTSPRYNGKTPTYWRDFNDMSKPAPTIERQRPQSNDRINRSPVNTAPQRTTPPPQRSNSQHR